MSKTTPAPEAQQQNVDLVLSNTVSRLGCTVAEARKILAEQAAKEAANSTPAKPGQPPASKGESSDEALL